MSYQFISTDADYFGIIRGDAHNNGRTKFRATIAQRQRLHENPHCSGRAILVYNFKRGYFHRSREKRRRR